MTNQQIISVGLSFALFNLFNLGVIASLVAFHLSSRPIRQSVPASSLWFLGGLFWFIWANISLVWAAPAENAFINANQLGSHFFDLSYAHFQKLVIGMIFFVLGAVCFMVGWFAARSQRARLDAQLAAPASARQSSSSSMSSATPA